MDVRVRPFSDDLVAEWDALCDRAGVAPFLYPGWVQAWCRAFGLSLFAAESRSAGHLTGVVPLVRSADAAGLPANWHTPVSGSVVAGDAAADTLARALLRASRRLVLWPVDASDPILRPMRDAAGAAGFRTLERAVFASPYVDTRDGWERYEKAVDTKTLRETRRRRRRAEERGLCIDVHDGTERLDELLDEGFDIEASGWKGDTDTSIRSSGATARFYRDVARWAAARGWLRLAFLRIADRAVAFDLAFEHRGVHYLVKTGYRPDASTFAPGMLMRLEMLRRAFDLGLERYDFLGGEAEWKRRWTPLSRPRLRIDAFDRTLVGTAQWAAHAYVRPIAKRAITRTRTFVHGRERQPAGRNA